MARSQGSRPTDEQLLDTAAEVFATQGYRAATMVAVAAAVPASKVTLYAHFGDKETLYQRLLAREAELCREWLVAAYDRNAVLGMRDQIAADMAAFFDYADARPHGFALLFTNAAKARSADVVRALRRDIATDLAARIRDYCRRDGIDTGGYLDQVAAMAIGIAVSGAEQATDAGTDLAAAGRLAASFCWSALDGVHKPSV